jgi:hypothetical protein
MIIKILNINILLNRLLTLIFIRQLEIAFQLYRNIFKSLFRQLLSLFLIPFIFPSQKKLKLFRIIKNTILRNLITKSIQKHLPILNKSLFQITNSLFIRQWRYTTSRPIPNQYLSKSNKLSIPPLHLKQPSRVIPHYLKQHILLYTWLYTSISHHYLFFFFFHHFSRLVIMFYRHALFM